MARNDVTLKDLRQAYMNAGIDPSSVSGFADQAASLFGGYKDSMALLRLDRSRLKQQSRQQIRDIRTQGRLDFSSAVGAANDRGVLGSSSDVSTRASVKSNTQSGVIAARDALTQGVQANLAQAMQARRDFATGISSLEAQKAAMKAMAGIGAYSEGLYDSLIPGGGGGGRGGNAPRLGKPGTTRRAVMTSDSFGELLRKLEGAGWRAGETGVPGFDPVDPWAHAATGNHYNAPKRTADLNYGPGGESAAEKAKLAKLYKLMREAGIPIQEWLAPGDPGHDNHGHLTVAKRRW